MEEYMEERPIKKRIKKIIVSFLVILIVIIVKGNILSYASSASLSLTTKNNTVTVGDSISVTLYVEADDIIGDFEAYITYDENVLEFKTGGPFVNGDDGLLKVSDVSPIEEEISKKYILKFKAIATGTSEIAIKSKAMIFNYSDGLEMSVSSKSLDISVKASPSASNNNNIKLLKISPSKLIPEFDPKITSYKVDVENEVTKLILSGITEDKGAKIAVIGAENLLVGENTVKIVVTAESGDEKEYSITVTRAASADEEIKTEEDSLDSEVDNNEEVEIEDKFKVYNEGGEIFIENSFKYKIIPLDKEVVIPSGYIKTQLILYGVQITAYTLESDLENDLFLIYAEGEDLGEGFYQYDRVEKTMQRYMIVPSYNDNEDLDKNEPINFVQYKNKIEQLSIVVAILSTLIAFLIIVIIGLVIKRKEYKDEDNF